MPQTPGCGHHRAGPHQLATVDYASPPVPTPYYSSRMIAPDDFVRVLTKDGGWIGGQVGATGFFTGYPETREVFVETAYALDESGTFGEAVEASAGVWVDCSDAQLVQYYATRPR